jgi:hypothetical protein
VRNYYKDLQVREDASPEVIKGSYKFLFQKWHPDKNLNDRDEAERMSRILNEAYSVLSDPIKRQAYDDERRGKAKTSCNSETTGSTRGSQPHVESGDKTLAFNGVWSLFLFVVGVLISLSALRPLTFLPFAFFRGEGIDALERMPILGVFICLCFGFYMARCGYNRLFHPNIIMEKRKKEAAPRKVARAFGLKLFPVATLLSIFMLLYGGTKFEAAILISLFSGALTGAFGWYFRALIVRRNGKARMIGCCSFFCSLLALTTPFVLYYVLAPEELSDAKIVSSMTFTLLSISSLVGLFGWLSSALYFRFSGH